MRGKRNRYHPPKGRWKKAVLKWVRITSLVLLVVVGVPLLSAVFAQAYYALLEAPWPRVEEIPSSEAETRGLIERINPREAYLERLRSLVNLEMIREARLKVVVDPIYGSAQGYLDTLLEEAGCEVSVLHNWRDPHFGGRPPVPADDHLQELAFQVAETSAHLGLATDGDAERFGLVDADGTTVEPNYFLGLLLRHLVETRGWAGGVFLDRAAR